MDASNLSHSSPKPSSFGEPSNENSQVNQQMGSDLKNQKKPTKNFMSPTISASSKAVVPRKKILSERNESCDESVFPQKPDFDLNPSLVDDDQKKSVFSSSSKPYDPLTNYLSPRPKFLRYNPERRRKTFIIHENESKGTEDVAEFDGDNSNSSASYSDESEDELVEEEIEESEDEFEEIEEEKSLNLKGVLKTLLVFAIVCVSTVYISTMNSNTPQPLLQNISKFQNGVSKIQNPLLDAISLNCSENQNVDFLDEFVETEVGLLDLSERVGDELGENKGKRLELLDGEDEDAISLNRFENQNVDFLDEFVETEVGLLDLGERGDELDENKGKGLESQDGKVEDACDQELDIKWEASDLIEESDQVHEQDEQDNVQNGDLTGEIEEGANEGYEEEIQAQNDVLISEESDLKHMNTDTEVNLIDWVVQLIQNGSRSMTKISIFIGISAICLILASLLLPSNHKFLKSLLKKSSLGTTNRCSVQSTPEKNVFMEVPEQQEYSEKIATFGSLVSSMEEEEQASKVLYQSHAPTVELVGEFDVGEMSSSSIRSFQKKSRMMESDLSNYSISREEISPWSKRQSVMPMQSHSEFSFTDSPSYGSFSAQKKIVKKDEEVRKVITTPVRRSSRIQNRAALSP